MLKNYYDKNAKPVFYLIDNPFINELSIMRELDKINVRLFLKKKTQCLNIESGTAR